MVVVVVVLSRETLALLPGLEPPSVSIRYQVHALFLAPVARRVAYELAAAL